MRSKKRESLHAAWRYERSAFLMRMDKKLYKLLSSIWHCGSLAKQAELLHFVVQRYSTDT